jgi:hypothetical protein
MQLARYHPSTSALRADAVFVSALQRSDNPSAAQVRKAIAAAARAHGGQGCAQQVAQGFGGHPETAVVRMRWARAVTGQVFAWSAGPAQDSARLPRARLAAGRRWSRPLAGVALRHRCWSPFHDSCPLGVPIPVR